MFYLCVYTHNNISHYSHIMNSVIWSIFFLVIVISIVILLGIYFLFNKDKEEQQKYIDHLKKRYEKVKDRADQIELPLKDTGLLLLEDTIEYVKSEYHKKYSSDISKATAKDTGGVEEDKTKSIMIAGYQMLVHELNGLKNCNKPEQVWKRIYTCLQIVTAIENELPPQEDLTEQLKIAQHRVSNLEKFKNLYFELQDKMSADIMLGESINAEIIEQIAELPQPEHLISLLEKHNTHYIDMGKSIDMDKAKHHYSVHYLEAFNEQQLEDRKREVKRLKSQVANQFEEIWELQAKLAVQAESQLNHSEPINDIMAQQLKDAELCIETMDMEIQHLTEQLHTRESDVSNELVDRFTEESKEMMSNINELEIQLNQKSKLLAKANAKCTKLEAEYANLEEKFIIVASHSH